MSSTALKPQGEPLEPTWDMAKLYPNQGTWTEEEYLSLDANRLIEFSDGNVEVLDMPTTGHQLIVAFLYSALLGFCSPLRLGLPLFAPLRVKLRSGKYREPDVVFMLKANAHHVHNDFWEGADLVMEVVSDDRRRDLEIKRVEYAHSNIPEYWIVDPQNQRITVLVLQEGAYQVHGHYSRGERASSVLLSGFAIDVTATLNAAASHSD
ncbi:MAG TPA: Uma2 family endonuclease [Tepidisphaeraceae bacterium]|jgi:Uma2 family endonuclease